jgi:hypothetical protein
MSVLDPFGLPKAFAHVSKNAEKGEELGEHNVSQYRRFTPEICP